MGTVKNVEMNYFNGADYDVIRPEIGLENVNDFIEYMNSNYYDQSQINGKIETITSTPIGWEDVGNFQGNKTVSQAYGEWRNSFTVTISALERNYFYFMDMVYGVTVYATTSDYVNTYCRVSLNKTDLYYTSGNQTGASTIWVGHSRFEHLLANKTNFMISGTNQSITIPFGQSFEWNCSFSSNTIYRQQPVVNDCYLHLWRVKVSNF